MADLQNPSPTIINPSDLPTRRRKSSSSTSTTSAKNPSSFSFPLPAYTPDPFARCLSATPASPTSTSPSSDEEAEEIDAQEIFDLLSTISDPEHPVTLGSLAVVSLPDISIRPLFPPSSLPPPPLHATTTAPLGLRVVTVLVTPTISHCSLATVIGLGIRVRLEESLPPRFRVDVRIKEGTHSTADEVNRQLADKERVSAAMWNSTLRALVGRMLQTCK
jgi:metal-sulfur cluster biosynthetic enzyme